MIKIDSTFDELDQEKCQAENYYRSEIDDLSQSKVWNSVWNKIGLHIRQQIRYKIRNTVRYQMKEKLND